MSSFLPGKVADEKDPLPQKSALRSTIRLLFQAYVYSGFGNLFVSFLTPVRGEPMSLSSVYTLMLCSFFEALLIMAAKSYVTSKSLYTFRLTAFLAVFNLLALPAAVVVWARVPSVYAMPHLLLAFWISVIALVFTGGIKLSLLESSKVPGIIFGGGIGIAGFVLLITQMGVVANGFTVRLPITAEQGQSNLPLTDDIKIAVRFEGGSLRNVYLDSGMQTVLQPAYYHYVDYTVYHPGEDSYSGRHEVPAFNAYEDALQCMFSFGLVKPAEARVSFVKPSASRP